jgi:hypothetical protein
MSEEERSINQLLMDRNRILAENVVKAGESVEASEKKINDLKKDSKIKAESKARASGYEDPVEAGRAIGVLSKKYLDAAKNEQLLLNMTNRTNAAISSGMIKGKKATTEFNNTIIDTIESMSNINSKDTLITAIPKLQNSFNITKQEAEELWNVLKNPKTTSLEQLEDILTNLSIKAGETANTYLPRLKAALANCGYTADEVTKIT